MSGKGQRVGYIRVSSVDQNVDRQLDGVQLDKRYVEYASGRDVHRPELQEMISYVREGDTIFVSSFDRLARNVDDLRRIVQEQTSRGVQLQFLKENLTFTGQDSPMANLLLSLLGAVAQFERDLIRERQREGIALAKRRGVYRGRKRALTEEQAADLGRRVEAGENKSALAAEYSISRETLYQYLRTQISGCTESREHGDTEAMISASAES